MNKEYTQKIESAGVIPLDANVEMVHLDKDGNVKPIFQEYPHTVKLMEKGILSPLWINGKFAPILSPFLGTWKKSKIGHNLITDAGRASIAARINAAAADAAYASIGQGTGSVAANVADTTLGTEVKADGTGAAGVHAIAAATATRVTTTVTNDTAQLVGTVSETATIAVTESGVFNATTSGTMIARQVFTAVNVVNGDSLQFTWKIKAA